MCLQGIYQIILIIKNKILMVIYLKCPKSSNSQKVPKVPIDSKLFHEVLNGSLDSYKWKYMLEKWKCSKILKLINN